MTTFHSNLSGPLRPLKNTEARQGMQYALENTQMNYLRLELKVCEGCGVLWLRTGVGDGVYCQKCAFQLSAFPAARGKHGGGRKPHLVRERCSSASRKHNGVTR